MSPVNSNQPPPRRDLMINGIRPSPLKINKDSHAIQKPSTVLASQAAAAAAAAAAAPPKQQQRQGPVIIYTHSPKIIHTQARDFMALVQKLTGFSSSDHEVKPTAPSKSRNNKVNNDNISMKVPGNIEREDNDSSSALTEENGGVGDVNNVSSSSTNPFFADIPLFTPNSADFFCSPRPVFKFTDNTIVSPTLANLNSPSLLEFMKGLPDY